MIGDATRNAAAIRLTFISPPRNGAALPPAQSRLADRRREFVLKRQCVSGVSAKSTNDSAHNHLPASRPIEPDVRVLCRPGPRDRRQLACGDAARPETSYNRAPAP